ncbi:response regulator, partial [uncultured Desulfovibrio sp.]|uniref:response regulator n=1 Tax=uncultured Desulfovibrio sp. TaxID=167968 RepID=UPI0028042D7E
ALGLARAAGNDGYSLCLISREVPGGAARLARRLREAVGGKRLVVALLGGNWTEAGNAAPEAGVDACLGMPLFWSDVRACLSPAGEAEDGADDRGRAGARSGHILLAEDNAMNQEIAVEFLTEAGYSVDVAANGREAVEMLAASAAAPYDVVLMDVQMPVLDGYGATQAIRALDDAGLASVPIIAMTANSFEEDKREALARGMNGHIAKPIDFNILFRTLDTLLE